MNTLETEAKAFLNQLLGTWDLTGHMGHTPLHQHVVGQWVLEETFMQMACRSTHAPQHGHKRYEALYHIGYNVEQDVYVLHLLDTFGVATACAVGVARRDGDTLPFVFNYASGPFTNCFIWEAAEASWRFVQTFVEKGQTQTFATKRMVRRGN